MKTSPTIGKIAPALLSAQKLMGAATKGSANPYFKSKYADLGAVLESCKDLLNSNGVTILQPHLADERGKFVETLLLHESGEWISGETEIVCSKESDPQAQGSAITYARRYGLQSLLSIPAEDDDGEAAMNRKNVAPPAKTYPVKAAPKTEVAAATLANAKAMQAVSNGPKPGEAAAEQDKAAAPATVKPADAPAKRPGGFKPPSAVKNTNVKANGSDWTS